MKTEQKILKMIMENSESLFGIEYENIVITEYCSIKDVIDYGIEAYFKKEIYDYSSDEDKVLGTEKEKAEALALYFEILANQLRIDYKLEKKH
jgi:hypothetical protein